MTVYLYILLSCRGNQDYDENGIPILGSGKASLKQLELLVRRKNKSISKQKLGNITELYISESAAEGINHDVAFAQMCLETNFLNFTGVVSKEQNNFAGIGAINQSTKGFFFPDAQIGIRAHIQHLMAYASKEQPKRKIVDPRFGLVKRGSCIYVEDLSGKWANDNKYGKKISAIIAELLKI